MKATAPLQARWWQWPTILSLDAPAVSLAWQWMLAQAAQVRLAWPAAAVLGASVWLAYAADRWIEGCRLPPAETVTVRHRFYQRHRLPVAIVWTLVFFGDLAIAATRLRPAEVTAGLLLLGPVVAYLLSHQLLHRDRSWRVPKELCVAALLGGGVAVFIVAQPGAALGRLALPLALFAFLCLANCALISTWEQEVDAIQGQSSLARQFRRGGSIGRTLPGMLALVSAAVAAVESGHAGTAAWCALAASGLLAGVDALEPRAGRQLARVLADIALLTPLLPLLGRGLRP